MPRQTLAYASSAHQVLRHELQEDRKMKIALALATALLLTAPAVATDMFNSDYLFKDFEKDCRVGKSGIEKGGWCEMMVIDVYTFAVGEEACKPQRVVGQLTISVSCGSLPVDDRHSVGTLSRPLEHPACQRCVIPRASRSVQVGERGARSLIANHSENSRMLEAIRATSYEADWPPSSAITCPVRYRDAGDARKTTAPFRSSGVPKRPIGIRLSSAVRC